MADLLLVHFRQDLEGRCDMSVADLNNPLSLVPVERSVLRGLSAGHSLIELAQTEDVSPREITRLVRQLYRKMQLALHAGDLALA